jgi:hypothetical protein
MGVKSVLWPRVGLGGVTCQAGRPVRVSGRPSFMVAPTLGIGYRVHRFSLTHKTEFEKAPTPGRPVMEVGLAGLSLARFGLGFVPNHPLMSYSL